MKELLGVESTVGLLFAVIVAGAVLAGLHLAMPTLVARWFLAILRVAFLG